MIKLILFLLGMVAYIGSMFTFVKLFVVCTVLRREGYGVNWGRWIFPVQFVKPTDPHFQCKCCTHEHLISRMVCFAKPIDVVMMLFCILLFMSQHVPKCISKPREEPSMTCSFKARECSQLYIGNEFLELVETQIWLSFDAHTSSNVISHKKAT